MFGQLSATVAVTNVGCSSITGGSAIITATGGVAPYMYSIDGSVYQASNTFTNLQAGTYVAIVKDANNDEFSLTFIINLVQPIIIEIATTADIPASTAIAIVSGGTQQYIYSWQFNGAPIAGSNLEVFNLLSLSSSGELCCTVFDANGCGAALGCLPVGPYFPVSTQNETITMASSDSITTSSVSVLANDFVNGLPANSPQNIQTISLTGTNIPSNFITSLKYSKLQPGLLFNNKYW